MHDRALGALDGLEGALDQLVARLGQDLDGYVVGDQAFLDDLADEIEIGLRGGREPDLDLLEAEAAQELEHALFALDAHRLDEGLVAVAQIDRAPDRRLVEDAAGPLAVGQGDGREGAILGDIHHGRISGAEKNEGRRQRPLGPARQGAGSGLR
jgi:hypothetical protein